MSHASTADKLLSLMELMIAHDEVGVLHFGDQIGVLRISRERHALADRAILHDADPSPAMVRTLTCASIREYT